MNLGGVIEPGSGKPTALGHFGSSESAGTHCSVGHSIGGLHSCLLTVCPSRGLGGTPGRVP